MSPQNETIVDTSDREIFNTRVIDYPPEKVFEAFQNPEYLARWWGPEGFTNTFETFDFQPGGTWKFVMHGPDGTNYPNTNIFSEIVAPERVVFDHVLSPVFQMTITCEKIDPNKTRFGFRMLFETTALCQALKPMCLPANEQNFDRLETVLGSF